MNRWYFHWRGETRYFRELHMSETQALAEAQREAKTSGRAVFMRTPEGVLWDVIQPPRML